MKKSYLVLGIITMITFLTSCSLGKPSSEKVASNKSESLSISAAASLKDALSEIKNEYLKENKNLDIILNFGASGSLQKQIEEGAPVDLFLSAGKSQVDELDKMGLLENSSKTDLLKNELVIIVPKEFKDKVKSVEDLTMVQGMIAIGETGSVPVGQYAKEALEYYKLWDKLSERFVYAKDVKQIAAYVESGEVMAGFVYKSDAVNLRNSIAAFELPSQSHKQIIYPAAVIKNSKNKAGAHKFLEYLKSDKAKGIFEKYGFQI